MHRRISIIFSTGLLALGISGAAIAQQASPTQSTSGAITAPASAYTDAQLNKFIHASQKVAVISQEYTPKLQASKDEATQRKVVKEADDKMLKAVHDEGMTVDQFNGLNQAVRQDPKLLQRIQAIANK